MLRFFFEMCGSRESGRVFHDETRASSELSVDLPSNNTVVSSVVSEQLCSVYGVAPIATSYGYVTSYVYSWHLFAYFLQ